MPKTAFERAAYAARWLRSRFIRGGVILLYHRVAEAAAGGRDPFQLRVSRHQFEEHLEAIRQHMRPVSLGEVLDSKVPGKKRKPFVAVTFDDGYADNLHLAKSLLERYEIPATVFVVSGSIGEQFWWDQLARCLLDPEKLPEELELSINGRSVRWKVEEMRVDSRVPLLRSVYRALQPLQPSQRRIVLERLQKWSGNEQEKIGLERAMTRDEILELAGGGLIEVGAHTVSHRRLALLEGAEQRAEIAESQRVLEEVTGKRVKSFSYPYGQRGDYDANTIDHLRRLRFEAACTNVADIVRPSSDPHQLPRLWVRPSTGRAFAARMRRWLHF